MTRQELNKELDRLNVKDDEEIWLSAGDSIHHESGFITSISIEKNKDGTNTVWLVADH